MKPPICTRCPSCGCREFHSVQSAELVSFGKDRLCLECGTRYSPPTPAWATIVFFLLGGLLCVGCGLSILIALLRGIPAALPANIGFFVLGVLCIRQGVLSRRETIVSVPDVDKSDPEIRA